MHIDRRRGDKQSAARGDVHAREASDEAVEVEPEVPFLRGEGQDLRVRQRSLLHESSRVAHVTPLEAGAKLKNNYVRK